MRRAWPAVRQAWPAAVVAVAVALLLTTVSGVGRLSFATPPDTTAPAATTTTAPPDFTGATEATVAAGSTSVSAAFQPGKATLTGVVTGPSGPVGGASVEVDRFVGSQEASLRVTAGPDGGWVIPNIKGGRYRVRGWLAPALDMTNPQVFFLGGTETRQVPLTLSPFTTQHLSLAANPLLAPVGEGINVEASVQAQTVDTLGYVSYQPSPQVSLQLSTSGPVQVVANPVTTDSQGLATFTLMCQGDGAVSGTVAVANGTSQSLPSLDCYTLTAPTLPPAPPPTPAPAPAPPTTPTTTPPPPPSSTTTTILPPVPSVT